MNRTVNSIKYILQLLIGLTVIGGFGFLIYKIVIIIIDNMDKVDANIFVALIAGSGTIIGYFITRYLERKKIIEQQIREQKLPVYEEFMDFIFKLFKTQKDEVPLINDELHDFYWSFNKKAILWLSDRSLKSYTDWRDSIVEFAKIQEPTQEQKVANLLAFEKLLLDFRKDIGHNNKDFSPGNILSMFINDWSEFSTKIKIN